MRLPHKPLEVPPATPPLQSLFRHGGSIKGLFQLLCKILATIF